MLRENEETQTLYSKIQQAIYHKQRIPSYEGNPLIEALPPIYSRDEIYKRTVYLPNYSTKHRRYSSEERLHMLGHGQRFFQPLSKHTDIARRFSRMLRDGYIGRNPLHLGFWPESKEKLSVLSQQIVLADEMRGFNQGFTIMGVSGMGKSRALERITSLYPQVIQHTEYNGRRFTWRQLVWLKLDCPFDGTLSGLCTQFFREVDQKLCANYHAMYGIRNSPPRASMLSMMATVASNHSLGALIIDEIQNLKETRRKDGIALLNFLVQLDNTIGVPVVLVGTPQAAEVLGGEFRRARRAGGQGDLVWERMPNDKEWRFFLETLWKYQYTQHYIEIDDELAQTLYYESQGIIDIAIKIFFLAQMHAIVTGEEKLSRSMLQRASRQSLRLVQPFLEYLRQNDTKKLR